MKLIKMLGLTAIATVATLAFGGAGTASASPTETALCTVNVLVCPEANLVKLLHLELVKGTVFQLLSGTSTVLCLTMLSETHIESPYIATGSKPLYAIALLIFGGCGSNAAHSNCSSVKTTEDPLVQLKPTSVNLGTLSGTATNPGVVNVQCTVLGIPINCDYSGQSLAFQVEGALHTADAGHGMITGSKTPAALTVTLGGLFCLEGSTLDFLLEALQHAYIVGAPGKSNALCKTHNIPCPEADLVKEAHMESSEPVRFLNSVANIECSQSLFTASILGLEPEKAQKAHVSAWSWKDCHTEGAIGNCSISTVALPDIEIERTKLNLGTATLLEVEFAVECNVLGLHEMDCSYGGTVSLELEGALHASITGHGMLRAGEIELKRVEEGVGCAESTKWDASYEPLEHIYVMS